MEPAMIPLWSIEELQAFTSPQLRPAVHVYVRETQRTHIGIYSPRDTETATVMYGAACQCIVVSWAQLRDALHFQRPLTA